MDNRGRFCMFATFAAVTIYITDWLYGAFNNKWITFAFICWLVWILHRPISRPVEKDTDDNIIDAEVIED